MPLTKSTIPNNEWCGEFSNICEQRPEDYSYYGAMTISWGEIENYECYHKLGRGKYSEVFMGMCKKNNKKVVKVEKQINTYNYSLLIIVVA